MSATSDLLVRVAAWEAWATTADRAEDGWPSDFPGWEDLVSAAWARMNDPSVDEPSRSALARCWAISDESEDLLDLARPDPAACWSWIEQLATVDEAACRWQIYELCGDVAAGEPILRAGLADPDPYARRRAILGLARLRPADARALAEPLLTDADPYIRQASLDLVDVVPDQAFRASAVADLSSDPVDHVRRAALSRRP